MAKARIIRAISIHADGENLSPSPIAEAVAVFSADQGPIHVGDRLDIDEFGQVVVDNVWKAGDPAISHQELAYDALEGELVVAIFRPRE